MTFLIIIFGALTAIAGIVIMVNPEYIFSLFVKRSEKLSMHILAIIIRIALGLLFIYQAKASKYPNLIEIFGWFSIGAAIVLSAIGRDNFKSLMSWASSLAKPVGRFGGFLALSLGVFIIYAFL